MRAEAITYLRLTSPATPTTIRNLHVPPPTHMHMLRVEVEVAGPLLHFSSKTLNIKFIYAFPPFSRRRQWFYSLVVRT